MTTIALTSIPPEINTVERLAAYSLLLLSRLNPTLAILEVLGEPEVRAAFTGIGDDSGGKKRLIGRISLELDADFSTSTGALWLDVKELSNVSIPAQYLAP